MRICLNMIVKNEAVHLPRLFASVHPYIHFFVIADTGSDDGTPDLVHRLGKKYGIPGLVTYHRWSDFANNRNLAFKDAVSARQEGHHDCDWVMVIDADEWLEVSDQSWTACLDTKTTYSLYVRSGSSSVRRKFLLNIAHADWVWRGQVHAWPFCNTQGHSHAFLPCARICTEGFQGAKSRSFTHPVDKAFADKTILVQELEGYSISSQDVHRWFQAAYACYLSNAFSEAVVRFIQILSTPSILPDIRYAAAVMSVKAAIQAGIDGMQSLSNLEQAVQLDPHRWEAYYYMALLLHGQGKTIQAVDILNKKGEDKRYPADRFWIEHDVYDWKWHYEKAILLFEVGSYTEAIALSRDLIKENLIPQTLIHFLRDMEQKIRVQKDSD